jgi:VanZ family protein
MKTVDNKGSTKSVHAQKRLFTGPSLIIIFSSLPNLPQPKITVSGAKTNIRFDYLIHFLEFFVLALLFILMSTNNKSKLKPGNIFWYTILGLAAAFLIEVSQEIIPGRAFNIIDFIYNGLGLLSGILFICLLKINKRQDITGR